MPEKKNAKKESTAVKQPAEEKKAVIYLGPAIPGVATPGTVYRNGLTPQLDGAVKEFPALSLLLAETSRAGQVRKDLRDSQSAVAICYQKALEYAQRKGVKG